MASTPAFRRQWDVFLSFRGEDTRHDFTDRLYIHLLDRGIRAFRDNEGLNRGDEINSGLLDAIEDSAAFIAIISPKYASSHWCLEELAKVCECHRLILPVFYKVDPSDVRHQRGPFLQDFINLEARFGEDKVSTWRKAMKKAGGIAGYVVSSDGEPDLIRILANRVLDEVKNTPLGVAAYTVGLDSRVEELLTLLDLKSSSIKVLGLYGMGGVGKTTLAKALYNRLADHFESRSFISEVKEILAQENGLLSLQNKLVQGLSSGEASPVTEVNAGVVAIEGIVHEKRVLIVMDDVDDANQLQMIAGRRKWFYEGSRIIITTRDRGVLCELHENELYEVKTLGLSESLQLFSQHALRRVNPTKELMDLSNQIVSLTGGMPLALEVFGSFLHEKRKIEEWNDALQKLKQIRPKNLQDVLKISFDGLDEQEKCIFLDIACLFVKMRMNKEDAIDILKGCGFRAEMVVKVLAEKSLIKIVDIYGDDTLWMHDQIRDMGRQIVLHENHEDPGMRTRLWDRIEIMRVLQNKKGTRYIQGIILDFTSSIFLKDSAAAWYDFRGKPNFTTAITYLKEIYKEYIHHAGEKERKVTFQTKSFESMINLRLLQINNIQLEGKCKFIPAELKWLQWKGCTWKAFPSDLSPQELRVLDLSESKIEQLWGFRWWSWYNKVGENLMVLNLRDCQRLTAIPDLSGNRALEKLILERCYGLTKIHNSIGNVTTLLHLDLSACRNLVEFPSDVSGLKRLEILIFSGCSKLKELPEDMRCMKSLRELLLDETAIGKLPESIFCLTKLEKLSLSKCKSLKQLPICIGKLSSLRELWLDDSALEEMPDSIGSLRNLEKLNLMWCRLTTIPDSVGGLKSLTDFAMNGSAVNELPTSVGSLYYLKALSLGKCRSLSKLPASVEGLASMVELQLDETPIIDLPHQIGSLKTLKKLEMRNCTCLRSLPEAIGRMMSLNTLIIVNAAITELPESIGMLEDLITLNLNKCKQLCRLPASIGNLKSLHHLRMEETAVEELPDRFGMLSSLMTLLMAKKPHLELPQNIRPMETKVPSGIEKLELNVLPTSFSNLLSLKEFDARSWKISGKILDDFNNLSSLEILNLGQNNFSSLPSSLRGLSLLKKLSLPHCEELESLPPLPSSLQEVNVENCCALGIMSDLSNLERLETLNLVNCKKLVDVPGIKCLKSLKDLLMSGCSAAAASTVKREVTKIALKKLRTLSIPGSEIPNWFSRDSVIFRNRKNLVIKGVIIGVVVSLNHHLRYQYPIVPGIRAQILRTDRQVFSTMLRLQGVPKPDEDQLYLCRYHEFNGLVFMLKDGDKIQVNMQNPAMIEGIELKKAGIHLVFENDDDYDEDEESVQDNQQTVSEKLAKFFRSCEGVSDIPGSMVEVKIENQEMETKEKRKNLSCSIRFWFLALPSFILLLGWLWVGN